VDPKEWKDDSIGPGPAPGKRGVFGRTPNTRGNMGICIRRCVRGLEKRTADGFTACVHGSLCQGIRGQNSVRWYPATQESQTFGAVGPRSHGPDDKLSAIKPPRAPSPGKAMRLLIVEDDDIVRMHRRGCRHDQNTQFIGSTVPRPLKRHGVGGNRLRGDRCGSDGPTG